MGEAELRRGSAWRFVREVVRSQSGGVLGAVSSGLFWQAGAVAAPLVVKYAIDNGVVTKDGHALTIWLIVLLCVGLVEVVAGGVCPLHPIPHPPHPGPPLRDAVFAPAPR